jgi:hypothetical protein
MESAKDDYYMAFGRASEVEMVDGKPGANDVRLTFFS